MVAGKFLGHRVNHLREQVNEFSFDDDVLLVLGQIGRASYIKLVGVFRDEEASPSLGNIDRPVSSKVKNLCPRGECLWPRRLFRLSLMLFPLVKDPSRLCLKKGSDLCQ